LLKAHVRNRAMEVEQGAPTAELESDNTKWQLELERARQALAEDDTARISLSMNQEKLERECMALHPAINALKEEMIQVLTDHEATVVVKRKKFRDYHLSHRKWLCELHAALEGALNEVGMRCLPYPEKGRTIGDVIAWFKKEVVVFIWLAICYQSFLCQTGGEISYYHVARFVDWLLILFVSYDIGGRR
jgi:hypothetical protein